MEALDENTPKMQKTPVAFFAFLHPEQLFDLPFVESDNHIIANENHWNAHLAGLLYHLGTLGFVLSDIVFSVSDIVRLEEFFGHLAEVAGRGRVN